MTKDAAKESRASSFLTRRLRQTTDVELYLRSTGLRGLDEPIGLKEQLDPLHL